MHGQLSSRKGLKDLTIAAVVEAECGVRLIDWVEQLILVSPSRKARLEETSITKSVVSR